MAKDTQHAAAHSTAKSAPLTAAERTAAKQKNADREAKRKRKAAKLAKATAAAKAKATAKAQAATQAARVQEANIQEAKINIETESPAEIRYQKFMIAIAEYGKVYAGGLEQ